MNLLDNLASAVAGINTGASEAADQLATAFKVLIGEGAVIILLLLVMLYKKGRV